MVCQQRRVKRLAPTALMLGNFVTGTSVLAPAGMLSELSSGLGVGIREAGLLITFGAVVLCIGSPLTAWLTSRVERRTLLGGTLAVLALTNVASAFAPDYTVLLIIRLVMLAIGSLFTPQAAGTVGMITPPEKRGGTIAYVFLGWSLAAAVGLPLVTFVAGRYGWHAAYGGVGAIAALSFLLLAWRLPAGLFCALVDLEDLDRSFPQPAGRAVAADHDAADVRAVRSLYLAGAAAQAIDRCRSRCGRPGVRDLGRLRLHRPCDCEPHRRFLGRHQHLAAGDRAGAGREWASGRSGPASRSMMAIGVAIWGWALLPPIPCSRCVWLARRWQISLPHRCR